MPEPLAPPEGQEGDATGLLTQIVGEEQASRDTFIDSKVTKSPKESTSKPNDEKPKVPADTTESEPTPEGEEPKADTEPEEGEEPEEGTEPADKPEPPKDNGPVRIGEREFATTDDALKEAARIMGHNGNLAGQLRDLGEHYQTLHSTATSLKTQLDEAVRYNQEWQEWYNNTREGKETAAPVKQQNLEEVVEKVMSKQKQEESERRELEDLRKEVELIESQSNYPQVYAIVDRIADKLNPLTGKPFTPREAYAYACREVGVPNLLDKKPAAPKPLATPAARNAAARPSTKKGPAPAPAKEKDFADRMLDEKFPLL